MKEFDREQERRFEAMLANLLQAGVILAAATVLLGAILYLIANGTAAAAYRTFASEPDALRSVPGIITQALGRHGRGIIQLGLLFLIATPIIRVLVSIVAFTRQRDWLYVGLTVVVFAVLLGGMLSGHH